MTLFKTWQGWLTAISATVGFVIGAAVLIRAAQLWRRAQDPLADPAVITTPPYGLFCAALLIAGAGLTFWRRPLVLMAAWG